MHRAIVAMLVSGGLVACQPTEGEPKHLIKLGAVIDRTGQNSEPGFTNAILVAQDDANKGLEQAGSDIRFVVDIQDSQSEPSIAVERATALTKETGIKGLIADTSLIDVELNLTHYDANPDNDLNVPIVCGGCSSGSINNPTSTHTDPATQDTQRNALKWNFKAIMSAKLVAQIVMQEIVAAGTLGDVNGDGIVKIGVYDRNEPGVKNTAKDLSDIAKALNLDPLPVFESILHPRDVDSNTYEWGGDIALLVDNKTTVTDYTTGQIVSDTVDGLPDAIVVSTFAQFAAAFVREYKEQAQATKVWHFQAFRVNSTLDVLGAVAEGEEGVSHAVLDNGESGTVFASRFQEMFGVKPVYRNSQYYDAAMVMMQAALMAAKDLENPEDVSPAAIRDLLPSTSVADGQVVRTGPDEFAKTVKLILEGATINYEGSSGPMDFDANQGVKNKLARYKVQGGEFVDVQIYDCVSSNACPPVE